MAEIISIPLSYLHYYHMESMQNPHLSSPEHIEKQRKILDVLEKKGGVGEDNEVAVKKSDLDYFALHL